MRRTLLMIAAVALLLTQCRKPVVEYPTAGPTNENMVSMTVTVGHGRTLIDADGTIKWSAGDKLYVGDGSKYIGCLELKSGADSPTGTFSGTVSATAGDHTFGFYYLGSKDYSSELTTSPTTVDVDFSSQNIYNNGGKLEDASKHHVGYGTASGKVDGTNVVLDTNPVQMTSKVAIAYFDFKNNDGTAYTGALTLRGNHIYSKMTVNFNASDFDFTPVKDGNISLDGGHAQRYVMLVPPENVDEETLNFGNDDMIGTTKLYKGIEANKFYCLGAGEPIEVTVKPIEFTVGMDGDTPRKVKFSKGNLYWDGSAFRFEANQWDYRHYSGNTNDAAVIGGVSGTTPSGTVGSFFWSKTASVAYASSYSDNDPSTKDVFFTNATETTANPDFHVNGETGTNQWRTLSKGEWNYLLNTRTNASSLRALVTLKITETVSVPGLVILPDGSTVTSSSVTTTASVASSGAVFLPAAGYRYGTGVFSVGSLGRYWPSTPHEAYEVSAYRVYFGSGNVGTSNGNRDNGYSVRLVR